MSIWTEVKSWWHVYIVGLFKPPVEPEEESAEAFLERVFPLESEWGMSKWKRFTTSTGSTYEVVDEARWRKNHGWLDRLWEFAAVPPWEDIRSEVVKAGLIEWSRRNGDMMRWPVVGECLFIMSRDAWWLSTPITKIEEWEEDE